jgi:hypothetical protein
MIQAFFSIFSHHFANWQIPKYSLMKYNILLSALFAFFIVVSGCKKDEPAKPIEPKTGDFPKQLTQDNLDYRAFLSPDGKYIAFYSMRYTFKPEESGINFELWLMSSDGFDQWRLILPNSIFPETKPTFLYWEADSKSMIVQIDDGFYGNYSKSEIWRIGIDGKKTQLYTPNLRLENVTYSPDRKKLAYTIQGKLYVADPDFTDSVRIEKGLINDYSWRIDSKGLIFSLYDRPNENFDIWTSKIDGTVKSRFSETPESEIYASYSSDEEYIAYYDDNSAFITPSSKFLPKLIAKSGNAPGWIPNRKLLLVTDELTDGNGSSWTEYWITDLAGNMVKKYPKGVFAISFSEKSKYYLFTQDGNIWMDYLP